VDVESIERLIDRHGAEAVIAALVPLVTVERLARIDRVLAARLASVVTIVEDTYDPHNVAATIRTTEALGLQELHVIESSLRFAASKGVTVGADRWIDIARHARAEDAIAALHARGFRVLAAMPDVATSVDAIDAATPVAVMFGNEHAGLSEAAVRASDDAVAVPMFGFAESFNLSVTVALAMSRVAERRRAVLGALGDLDDARKLRLRARWLATGVRAAAQVIERALGS
jgi:tRNA (guanosine-2'-O-)-methyltransferase